MAILREPTSANQVDIWRSASSESQRLEFKEAKNQFDNETLFKYCVALGNEGGGHLLLGISDVAPRPVVGTAAFKDVIATEARIFQNLGFRVDAEEVNHSAGRVLVFHIPSRPRGTAFHRKGAYLMRSGASLVPMTEDQLRKIFAEGEPNWLEEYSLTGLHSDDVIELLNVEAYFDLLPLQLPSSPEAAVDRLKADGLVHLHDGKFALKRLSALLLAQNLEDFPDLARKAMRVVVYNGSSKLDTKLERTGQRGYAVGFQGLVKFIGEQLPQNEVIKDAVRRETKLVPDNIMRELVANALIHQDFEITGASAMVEIYSDRVEISNPGTPEIPTERFIDGYQSRNERLAMVMRRLRICEEKGSGIDRVVQAAELLQLPAPDFRTGFRRTTVVILGPREFEAMERDDRIRACYQHCVLRYVMSKQMTNQSLRERFNLPEAKSPIVSQVIAATADSELIKPDTRAGGSRKFARYVPFWA